MSQVPRPRLNDPLGVSDDPVCVTDPVRTAAVVAEFQRKLAYVEQSYGLWEAHDVDHRSFNCFFARLKRAVTDSSRRIGRKTRLDPRLEILISHRARELAGIGPDDRLGADHVDFVDRAVREVATNISAVRGRPAGERVRHHVEGLMALIQETCGKPVLAIRDKEEVPRLAEGVSQMILLAFKRMDPGVTETQLFNIVRKARRVYAGKPMRFRDFFPSMARRSTRRR
jgi:hypothetical protein